MGRVCVTCKETKDESEFYRSFHRRKDGTKVPSLCSRCKTCDCKRVNDWNSANPERVKQKLRRNWIRQYGVTPDDYDRMFADQGGRCRLCNTDDPSPKSVFCVDHCHATGRVRGLLCIQCNTGLGMFKDNPEVLMKAAHYVKEKYL